VRDLYRYIWRETGRDQIRISLISAAAFGLTMVPLELQRRIVNQTLAEGLLDSLILLCALYLVVVLLQGGLKYWMNVSRGRIAEASMRRLRYRIHCDRQRHDDAAAKAGAEGTAVSMVAAEVEPLGGFVGESVSVPVLQLGTLVTVFAYLLWVQPLMGLVCLAPFAPQSYFVPKLQHLINTRAKKRVERLREVGDHLVEEGQEGDDGDEGRRETVERDIDEVYRLRMEIFHWKSLMKVLINLLTHLATLSVLLIGGYLVIRGETEVGTLVAFISGIERVNRPWRELIAFFRQASDVRVKFRLISDALQPAR